MKWFPFVEIAIQNFTPPGSTLPHMQTDESKAKKNKTPVVGESRKDLGPSKVRRIASAPFIASAPSSGEDCPFTRHVAGAFFDVFFGESCVLRSSNRVAPSAIELLEKLSTTPLFLKGMARYGRYSPVFPWLACLAFAWGDHQFESLEEGT